MEGNSKVRELKFLSAQKTGSIVKFEGSYNTGVINEESFHYVGQINEENKFSIKMFYDFFQDNTKLDDKTCGLWKSLVEDKKEKTPAKIA